MGCDSVSLATKGGAMPTASTKVLDQIRELNLLLIRSKLQIERTAQQQGASPNPTTVDAAHAAPKAERTTQPTPSDVSAFCGQGRILTILGLKPAISQKDLIYMLGTSRQAMSELLARLEHKGYIRRDLSAADKRMVTIRLTEAGRLAARQVRRIHHDMGADLLDCLSEAELAQFSEYLRRIIDSAEKKLANDEFAERRRAMREFLSLGSPTSGQTADGAINPKEEQA